MVRFGPGEAMTTDREQPELHTGSVLVPDGEVSEFTKRLRSLNNRAARLGLPAIEVGASTAVRYMRVLQRHPMTGEKQGFALEPYAPGKCYPPESSVVLLHRIDLTFPMIKLGDWQVVAQIEAAPAGNLVFAVSQDEADRAEAGRHRDCEVNCEHCNAKRDRKLSYLLRNGEGEYREVGTSCLEVFTGVNPAAALFIAQMYAACHSDISDHERIFNAKGMLHTRDFLIRVAFLIEKHGFISASKARDELVDATYYQAFDFRQFVRSDEDRKAFKASYERLGEHVDQVLAWLEALETDDGYLTNVKTLLAAPELREDRKHLAFAASALPAYERALRRQNELAAPPSEHVGVKGQKLQTTLTFCGYVPFDTAYGTSCRINVRDEHGNKLSWKTGSPPRELCDREAIGRTFEAAFKVKEHAEFRGDAITEISHLKFGGWNGPDCSPAGAEGRDEVDEPVCGP